jgi:exodeoxyribonuclease-3
MIVASFNVNSIRARLGILREWIKSASPDVLCLQETKVQDSDFPVREIEQMGFQVVYSGEKSYNGVAILSKHPLHEVSSGFEDGSESARLLSSKIRGITIINTYVPQGFHPFSDRFRYKLDWLQRLYSHVTDSFRPDMPVLWVGDFNIAPEPIDIYEPDLLGGNVGFHPDEHTALKRFRKWGFVDIFRLHNDREGEYTFWDYTIRNAVKKGMGWRIDHIWGSKALAEKSLGAWIDVNPRLLPRPSDHTPLLAEFDI